MSKRLGKGMLIIAWVLLLGVLTLFFNQVINDQNNPNREVNSVVNPQGQKVVTLKANRNHHYVASGKINGHDVKFMLDTGASDVAIPEAIADKIGLQKGFRGKAQTANGTITIYWTRLNSLQLGNITLHDVRASINPHDRSQRVLLGMSALRQLDFIQRNDELILIQR